MSRVLEIRTYRLRPGTREAFHRILEARSVPLLRAWGVDVVAHGPCAQDPDGYVLLRAFEDVAHLERSLEAFYESEDWKRGPREEIVASIEAHLPVVLEMDEAGIDALRGA